MRIVFVISHLIYGGAETQLINLSRELVHRGHAVTIYTLNAHNPRAHELEGSGVELVADQKKSKLDLAVLLRLRRFLKTYRADIAHGYLFDGDFYTRLAAAGTGVVAINSERSDNYTLNLNQKLGHYPTRFLARAVVANTQAGARFAQALFKLPASRTHTVWNGIDPDQIRQRADTCKADFGREFFGQDDLKVACLVGNIKPAKDYLLALQVADRLTRHHPEWRVLFVGEQLTTTGGYKGQILDAYQRLNLVGRAAFTGLRKDVPEILGRSRVLFSTSSHEGFPNVVLEAMAVGVPVVSTDYSDIRHILPQSWQVMADRQPESLVAAILRADAQHDELASVQQAWVEQHATTAIAAVRMEEVYRLYAV